MNPALLTNRLNAIVANKIKTSIMLWGAPGIGKSSIVAQVAKDQNLELIDVRLSQLAPTDLRGLPVPEDGIAKWFPPEFLPRTGKGILFLDEMNMAAPATQGIAQQLILDRKVGTYEVPDGWFIWAAGNRKEDAAAVAEMPAPLANRFIHFEVTAELASLTAYAIQSGWHPHVVGFINFMPKLIHVLDKKNPAWPSPRSWSVANNLYRANLPIEHAVGAAAGDAFEAYVNICANLPDIGAILRGNSQEPYPVAKDLQFAISTQMAVHIKTPDELGFGTAWVENMEQRQFIASTFISSLKADARQRYISELRPALTRHPHLQNLMREAQISLEELR